MSRLTTSSPSRRLGAALATAVLLAACTGDDAPVATGADPQTTGTDRDEPSEPEASGPAGTITLAGIQQSHASGTTIAVTGITVDEAGDVYLDLEALVAGRRGARLASDPTILEDDLGNRYEFVPPEANSHLDFAQDTQASVTLAFEGPIDPDATRVTFGINGHFRDGARNISESPANTLTPTFAFDGLPLPGVGLDDEGAGPDDAVGLQQDSASIDVTGVVHEGDAHVRIEITHIEVAPTLVTVTVEAINVGDREKNVIQAAPDLRAELDGQSLGNNAPFEFESLETEEGEFDRLTLGPGDEVTATFAFRGVVPPDATGLRMGFQVLLAELDRGAPSTPESQFSSPTVVFTELPLPDRAADMSDGDDDSDS